MIKVFISHKDTDHRIAEKVARRVRSNSLQVYLDSVDSTLLRDESDLADQLLKRLDECQQLIAVLSNETAESWWVPWEIGVGSEKGFRMASYTERNVYIPEYLERWPVLHSDEDVDLYCDLSKKGDQAIGQRTFASTLARQEGMRRSANLFHRDLKNVLR